MAFNISLLSFLKQRNKKYYDDIASCQFWDNQKANAVPQTKIYNIIDDFLSDGTIKDGKVFDASGKEKKVAFFGFDGGRADGLLNIFADKKSSNHYITDASTYSAISSLKKDGGLYIAFCGGETNLETEQDTSTSAGWTAEFTGVWHTENKVKKNHDIKTIEKETIFLKYAKLGLNTSFAFYWRDYFDINLSDEVAYLLEYPKLKLTYCIPNREIETKEPKKMMAKSLELHNKVANEKAEDIKDMQPDEGMRDYLLNRINKFDDTIIAGIFENCDGSGHSKGFGNKNPDYINVFRNSDNYAFQIISEIEKRKNFQKEEWLYIITSDHGGIKLGHGGQSLEERTIFIATNKKINKKYYCKNYDGYRENS